MTPAMTFKPSRKNEAALDIRHRLPDLIRVERHRYGRYQPLVAEFECLWSHSDMKTLHEIRGKHKSYVPEFKTVSEFGLSNLRAVPPLV